MLLNVVIYVITLNDSFFPYVLVHEKAKMVVSRHNLSFISCILTPTDISETPQMSHLHTCPHDLSPNLLFPPDLPFSGNRTPISPALQVWNLRVTFDISIPTASYSNHCQALQIPPPKHISGLPIYHLSTLAMVSSFLTPGMGWIVPLKYISNSYPARTCECDLNCIYLSVECLSVTLQAPWKQSLYLLRL